MYHFQYVAKRELEPVKKQLMELIHKEIGRASCRERV